ncbi:hypothetical protein RhiLY_00565 [Ceratobasidium sp. AG-Ba]|nr:hypothetical protein RhiLY_00565 [Ceratobasidium sp. AG-Ba]
MTTVQKIKEIEDEMARTQKNKATSYHLGLLKAKLAKLRRELISPAGGGGGGGGVGFDVARTGIASVGFVGFPSVGKSTLMSKLTGTHSEAAAYEFTTLTTVPGTLKVHGAPIQILDLPGIVEGAADGRGRGRQVIAGKLNLVYASTIQLNGATVARTCNLIFIVLDVLKPLGDKKVIETELEGFGIRLNKKPPQIIVRKKVGCHYISITNTVPLTNLDHESIKAVLSEFRISNADVAIREPDATADDLIDVIEGNRVYIPAIYVLNKIDAISIEELDLLYKIPNSCPISSKEWLNVDELIEQMWTALDLVRVYTKPRGQAPDYSAPVVLRRGKSSIEDFCNSIHKEIAKQMKYAVVWGSSAKHSRGQKVGLEHVLEDEDVMDLDHEIALMYASTPFSIFQPRASPYSPFENFLGSLETVDIENLSVPNPVQQDGPASSEDSTPGFDISERMAREMQEQEDREQEMMDRRKAFGMQMGGLMSSMFGGFHEASITPSGYREQSVNAEAGPSTIKPKPSFAPALRPSRSMPGTYPSTNDEADSDDSSKSAGKQRARSSSPYNISLRSDSMDLLDSVEATLKQETSKFDFPERLDFLDDPKTPGFRTPSVPVLAHTFNNASIHAHEQALSELLGSLDFTADDGEEEVQTRRLQLNERIKRELDELDRKVLEFWAATRRYANTQVGTEA